jgi:hypothetical protein
MRKDIIKRLGIWKIVTISTLLASLFSISLGYILLTVFQTKGPLTLLFIAAIIPIIMVPIPALIIIKILAKLENTEKILQKENGKYLKALQKVNQLSGLLPICANCKKIRDEKGSWKPIEIYISDKSDAQFSHSMCPSCTSSLYPNLKHNITPN